MKEKSIQLPKVKKVDDGQLLVAEDENKVGNTCQRLIYKFHFTRRRQKFMTFELDTVECQQKQIL